LELVAEGLEFPEGPVALADGSVLVSEIRGGTIARVDPDSGSVERLADTGGGPNGAALGPDGRLYVCNNGGFTWSEHADGLVVPGRALARGGNQPPDYAGGSIQVVDLGSGEVQALYTECDGNQLKGPNDIVFDDHRGFYFTDSGKRRDRDSDFGGLYYATADGSKIDEIAYPMVLANGVGLSPLGDRLYVTETITARVWAWQVEAPGRLAQGGGPGPGGAELVHTLTDYRLIDSLAVEAGGNVCLATLNAGAITVVSPAGEVVEVVPVADDDPIVTNVCFGGEGLRTAYVTAAGRGRLYRAEWPRPGLGLHDTQPRTG
jgi:gluconolactonase